MKDKLLTTQSRGIAQMLSFTKPMSMWPGSGFGHLRSSRTTRSPVLRQATQCVLKPTLCMITGIAPKGARDDKATTWFFLWRFCRTRQANRSRCPRQRTRLSRASASLGQASGSGREADGYPPGYEGVALTHVRQGGVEFTVYGTVYFALSVEEVLRPRHAEGAKDDEAPLLLL